ncbi:MAG: hypothetical protein K2X32_13145 [Phycisphaerales bacterium]|nr:hypothetical protein [Phycisphaerales bacterium]
MRSAGDATSGVGSDAFDALADLFLGGSSDAFGAGSVAAGAGSAGARPGVGGDARATREELDLLGVTVAGGAWGLVGVEAEERVASGATPAACDATGGERTQGDGGSGGGGGVRRAAEVMLIGNVPGFPSAWLAQIAGRDAATGAVMVIDARGAGVRVQCFGARVGSARDVAGAIDVGAAACVRVMLCCDASEVPEILSVGLASRVRLISGADEASVVAAYRLIKSVMSGASDSSTTVSVCFVGADQPTAAAAAKRLSDATMKFIGVHVEMENAVARLGGAGALAASEVFEGRRDRSGCELARQVARAGAARTIAAPAAAERMRSSRLLVEDVTPEVAPLTPSVEPETVDLEMACVKAEPRVEAEGGAGEGESLASVIGGLMALRARCPQAPAVELALDAAGGLHVIAAGDRPGVVAELATARAWAVTHRAVLALTTTRVIASGEPVSHVLSERPSALRHLLDAGLRVHAMVRATRAGVVAVALN